MARADLLSAALRHVRDAEALLESSVDQAWHLVGYGPECATKALLPRSDFDRALGHDLREELVELVRALGPAPRLPARPSELRNWSVSVRYERTGTARRETARRAVEAARRFVHRVVADAWCEGRIDEVPR